MIHERLSKSYTYSEFLLLLPCMTDESREEATAKLNEAVKPSIMCGVDVPDNLNLVSYGLLDDLANISKSGAVDPMVAAISMILGVEEERVYLANVFDVFGISKWIGEEIKRINKLFSSISPNYSPQELAAGVQTLNFGSFGVLDWYSHRQGISDQNLVRDVPWVRIFTCMKNDNIKAEYEKRLNKQYITKR